MMDYPYLHRIGRVGHTEYMGLYDPLVYGTFALSLVQDQNFLSSESPGRPGAAIVCSIIIKSRMPWLSKFSNLQIFPFFATFSLITMQPGFYRPVVYPFSAMFRIR